MTPLFGLLLLLASWDTASTLGRCARYGPLKEMVSRCFIGAAVFLAVFHVLGFAQLLSGWPVVRIDVAGTLAGALAIASRLLLSSASPRVRTASGARLAHVMARVMPGMWREPTLAIPALCAVVVHCLLIASVLSAPPRGFDALWYHLPDALRWYRSHTLDLQMGSYIEFYPGNGELFGLPLLMLANDSWVGLVQYPWFLLIAAIMALMARRAGATPAVALAGGLTVLTVPLLVYQAMQFYVDVICAALSLGSLLYLIDWMRHRRSADLILCIMTVSMMLGTKYVASFAWLLTVAMVVMVDVRARSRRSAPTALILHRLLLVCGLGTAFTWVWWARNFSATGNPIAPVHVRYLLGVLATGNLLSSVFAPSGADGLADLTRAFVWSYGPLIVLPPVALAVAVWRLRAALVAKHADIAAVSFAYIGWSTTTFAVFLTHDPRFLIAPVVLSPVLALAISTRAKRVMPQLLLVVALVNTGLVVYEIAVAGNFDLSINRRARNDFYGLPEEIDQLPPGARVLLRGHPALVYPVAGTRRTNVVYPSPMGSVEAEIAQWRIDYVLVRSAERADITRLAAVPSLVPISSSTLSHHPWWDYWPDHRGQFVALFRVVS